MEKVNAHGNWDTRKFERRSYLTASYDFYQSDVSRFLYKSTFLVHEENWAATVLMLQNRGSYVPRLTVTFWLIDRVLDDDELRNNEKKQAGTRGYLDNPDDDGHDEPPPYDAPSSSWTMEEYRRSKKASRHFRGGVEKSTCCVQ